MPKICLDAGHYGFSNQSPAVKSYYESQQMWKLQNYLKAALEKAGFTVITTRTDINKDLELTERGRKSKGCDLFISLHSNATGTNGVDESIDYPIVYRPINGKAQDIADLLINKVAEVMGTKQKGRSATRLHPNGKDDYYGVIRGAASVGVSGLLIEHSFHTNSKAANWLLVDANLKKLAEAEAEVLAEYYGVNTVPYLAKVTTSSLNIYKGAGANFPVTGVIKDKGVYTIVEVENGWGRLKSGAGWIQLTYTRKV